MTTQGIPNKPTLEPIALSGRDSAVVALDLNTRCESAEEPCYELVQRLAPFMERARSANVPIIYSISQMLVGTPEDAVAAPLARRESEPIIHPDNFDKFHGGELDKLLKERNVQNVVLVGSATNVAVLYTATAAARVHRYQVVLPVDGTRARNDYEQEYAIHQLSRLPAVVVTPVRFTSLDRITFQ